MTSGEREENWSEPVCPECGAAELFYEAEGYCRIEFAVTGVSDSLRVRGREMDVKDVEEDPNGEIYRVEGAGCGHVWEDGPLMDVIYDQAPDPPSVTEEEDDAHGS